MNKKLIPNTISHRTIPMLYYYCSCDALSKYLPGKLSLSSHSLSTSNFDAIFLYFRCCLTVFSHTVLQIFDCDIFKQQTKFGQITNSYHVPSEPVMSVSNGNPSATVFITHHFNNQPTGVCYSEIYISYIFQSRWIDVLKLQINIKCKENI